MKQNHKQEIEVEVNGVIWQAIYWQRWPDEVRLYDIGIVENGVRGTGYHYDIDIESKFIDDDWEINRLSGKPNDIDGYLALVREAIKIAS